MHNHGGMEWDRSVSKGGANKDGLGIFKIETIRHGGSKAAGNDLREDEFIETDYFVIDSSCEIESKV